MQENNQDNENILEKLLKELTLDDALELAVRYREKVKKLEDKLKRQEGDVDLVKRAMSSDDLIDMSEVSKTLNYPGYGRNKLFSFLREKNILRYNNQPYQSYVDSKCFKIIEQIIDLDNGQTLINLKTVVTQKGLDFIRKKLNEYTEKQDE